VGVRPRRKIFAVTVGVTFTLALTFMHSHSFSATAASLALPVCTIQIASGHADLPRSVSVEAQLPGTIMYVRDAFLTRNKPPTPMARRHADAPQRCGIHHLSSCSRLAADGAVLHVRDGTRLSALFSSSPAKSFL
jgi:hypothetical protein